MQTTGRVSQDKSRLANETLNTKAARGLNKLVNSDKSAQASDECAPGFLSAPLKSTKRNEAAPIRLFGKCAKTSEHDALNLTARQMQNQASERNSKPDLNKGKIYAKSCAVAKLPKSL